MNTHSSKAKRDFSRFRRLRKIGSIFSKLKDAANEKTKPSVNYRTYVSVRIVINVQRKSWFEKLLDFVRGKFKISRHV